MKKYVLLLGAVAGVFAIYWFQFRQAPTPEAPKQAAIKAQQHSTAFNGSIDSLLQKYFTIKSSFVEGDSLRAKQANQDFVQFAKNLSLQELQKDSAAIFASASQALGDVIANAESLGKQQTITDMRMDFKAISENLYPLLKTIHYEGKKLWWQSCPMAFDGDKEGTWLSSTEEVNNPYLGKNHPEYKGTMLHCGEVKDTIQ
jgi:uncharacterized protein YbjQ (UPF0145 family)